MLNTIFNAWVKYVNNQRFYTGNIGGYISTGLISISKKVKYCSQKQLIRFTFPYFNTIISTYNNLLFNLLNKSFTHNPQSLLIELRNEI